VVEVNTMDIQSLRTRFERSPTMATPTPTPTLTLNLALDIFYNSQIAANDPTARLSAATLKHWAKAGKVNMKQSGMFAAFMGNPGALTSFKTWMTADDVTMYSDVANAAGADNLAYAAILLAHEGVHASQRSIELESEVDAWGLAVDFYDELCTSPVTVAGKSYGISTPNQFKGFIQASQARANNQLIDWIIVQNSGYKAHIDAVWVVKFLSFWGGVQNRAPEIVSLYLEVLAKAKVPAYTQLALVILESYLKTLSGPIDRLEVVEQAGQPLREALVAECARAGKVFHLRIDALEKLMGIKIRIGAASELDYQLQKKLNL
jgi:hypothetical protein